ncbi:alpha-glucuronidase family glycosyl hydrolase [uncultured Bacteroides sp.]|uniref:alpha-glucuronidase family glycosyl hydrolase n=1 Tax=uncultured Bacteroides sp. TaxID=162156 RepID=UPI002AA77517|nr:alpha-glucuronidase family glycosyl hydrolase [uncultured Bacteroides sp.]
MKLYFYTLLFVFIPGIVFAEDGSQLWLRYQSLPDNQVKALSSVITSVACDEPSDNLAFGELQTAWRQLTGTELPVTRSVQEHSLVIGTKNSKLIQPFGLSKELQVLGNEGFIIRTMKHQGKDCLVLASEGETGVMYAVFNLLRTIQTALPFPSSMNVKEKPAYKIRVLNHWDNPDGTIERGYAGHSLWKWEDLPGKLSSRYKEYARANASIGINGTVLNNVNASPEILSAAYLQKVKALAAVFRPYGIRVYLSVNFSSPAALGGLPTSDPLNKDVRRWWFAKAKEIYSLIPDFGGFLVKANSEGLPGPQDFGRTHADGANMLADALKPYHGIVMWRAFVYKSGMDDRAGQAYKEFLPLDGKFRSNVILQVKNGPIDFQPREPISALFGAMKHTPIMPEFQITQEYLGESNHLVFLAPLYKECLDSDTYCSGKSSTVAKVTDGSLLPNSLTAIAGVANIGEDANWCGHHFAQANWYAFGRLAWNHELTSGQIADEWIKLTFNDKKEFVEPVKKMMLESREAVVNYMMPLGLHHLFAWGHHYGPEPWCAVEGARPDWLPSYYHKADSLGIGFNRTLSGSNSVSQYNSPLREQYNDLSSCPEQLILWFHHVPWSYKMHNGQTLWEKLCYTYDKGAQQVREFQKTWDRMEPYVDAQRFKEVQSRLKIQSKDAVWWKDACLLYFQTFSHQPIPYDIERPVNELGDLKKIKLNLQHHN